MPDRRTREPVVVVGAGIGGLLPVRGLHLVGDGCKAPGWLMAEGVARQVERVLGEIGGATALSPPPPCRKAFSTRTTA